MPLNIKQVLHAKPGRLSDGKGLYLLVKPKPQTNEPGAKSWVLRVMRNGDRRDYGLGAFTAKSTGDVVPLHRRKSLTLEEAREKARLGRELAKNGINPSLHWRLDEVEAEPAPTFEQAARQYHAVIAKGWKNGKHKDQWLSTLELYAFPIIGAERVDTIDANAIQRVLLPIWLTKGETSRRVKQRIGATLDYAHAKRWRETEAPMRAIGKLMGGIKQAGAGHFAAMPYKDLPPFMAKLRDAGFSVGNRALQFLILTVPRTVEIRRAKWGEIDLDAAEWRVPALNTKMGKPHIVPLVPAAVAILRELAEVFGTQPESYVFPGLKGMMSDATLTKTLKVNGGAGTVHGLRSTFRDWAADNGFNNDWAEASLAHSVAGQEGKTVAAYKRTTYYDQRRDRLMPAWESFALNDGSKVVSLAERRA